MSDSEYINWISSTSYTLDAGSTAYDLIKKALDGAGLKYKMSTSYLSSVNAPAKVGGYELAEFTNGSRSGWMFTVNGKHGSLSISQQELKNGDVIIVHYINDYLYEENEFPWLNAKDPVASNPVEDPNNPTNPTDPSNPTGPSNPTDPSNPSTPTDPSNPTNPSENTDPTDVTDPTNPDEPKVDDDTCTCWAGRFWWLVFLMGAAVGALAMWAIPVVIRKVKK